MTAFGPASAAKADDRPGGGGRSSAPRPVPTRSPPGPRRVPAGRRGRGSRSSAVGACPPRSLSSAGPGSARSAGGGPGARPPALCKRPGAGPAAPGAAPLVPLPRESGARKTFASSCVRGPRFRRSGSRRCRDTGGRRSQRGRGRAPRPERLALLSSAGARVPGQGWGLAPASAATPAGRDGRPTAQSRCGAAVALPCGAPALRCPALPRTHLPQTDARPWKAYDAF